MPVLIFSYGPYWLKTDTDIFVDTDTDLVISDININKDDTDISISVSVSDRYPYRPTDISVFFYLLLPSVE